MSLPRITPSQAQEVERLKGLGRTNSQIEKIVGLASGTLSRGFVVGEDPRPIRAQHSTGKAWEYPHRMFT